MKGFLRGILTVWITVLLMAFTLLLSVKGVIIHTADTMMKKELTDHVVSTIVENSASDISDEVIDEVKNTIQNNPEIKQMMDQYFDQALDILSSDGSTGRIDVSKELNGLIDEGEKILNDHGVTITEEQREELNSIASSEEINNLVNDTIQDVKEDLPSSTRGVLKTYKSLTSGSMKVGIIVLIIVSLILIALLKKSYYKWLSNFGGSLLASGIIVGVILPFLFNALLSLIDEGDLGISFFSLSTNGYVLIALGIISIVLYMIIPKLIMKKKKDSTLPEEQESAS